MSRDVEQRVVEMRFDNDQFERGISQSQASLEAFNKSLGGLGGSKVGLSSFAATLKGISFEPFTNGIQIGIGKLSALTAALTGVSNVADTVYNKVTGMIKKLSGIDNMTLGWDKYAQKTEAIQTIMAATRKEGESEAQAMSRVNEQIEQLGWFADETSYSLNDMTTAVGNFTSAGVDLEVATESVQGIALWAATAGVNSKKASTAFQQLAQAMSKGVLKTDDWKSLETLNMPSMEFKKQALEIAASLNTLRKEGDRYFTESGVEVTAEGLRQTLSEGWLTSDVMNKVFEQYGNITKKVRALAEEENITASEAIQKLKETGVLASEELSLRAMAIGQEAKTFQEAIDSITDAASTKFTDIFEAIFGNYIEAKKLWTDLANGLYKVFVDPLWDIADAFKEWKVDNGREKALESIYKIIKSIWEVFSKFKELWEEMWDTKGERIKKILDAITLALGKLSLFIEKFANELLSNEKVIDDFSAFAEGTKNVVEALKQVVVDLFTEIAKRFTGAGGPMKITEAISSIFGWIGKLLTRIAELINDSKIVSKAFELFDTVSSKLKKTFQVLGDTFKRIFETDTDRNIIWQMGNAAVEFKTPLETVRDILAMIVDLATDMIMQITPLIATVWSFIKAIISFVGKLVESFGPIIRNAVGMLTEGITTATETMTEYFNSAQFTNPFEAIAGVIKKIAEAIGKFVGIIVDNIRKVKYANMDNQVGQKNFLENLAESIVNFAETMYGHKEAVEWMQRTLFGGKDIIATISSMATALIDAFTHLAAGVLILYGITKLFNLICAIWSGDEEGGGLFAKATGLVKGFKTIYSNFMNLVAKFANAKLIKSFAFLIASFAASIFLLASLPSEQLIKASIALGVGILILSGVIKMIIDAFTKYEKGLRFDTLDEKTNTLGQGSHQSGIWQLAMLISSIGAAMLMMASSIAIIASCANWDSALIGFLGLALIITAVGGVLIVLKKMKFKQKDVSTIGMIGVLFMAIGKSMQYVAKGIATIGDMGVDEIFMATTALLIVLAAMVSIVLYVSVLKPKAKALKSLGTMLMELGFMFLAVAVAMRLVSKIDNFANAVPAIAILVVVVTAIVGLIAMVAKSVENLNSGNQVAALAMIGVMMMNMIGVIAAIAGGVLAIATLVDDSDKITAATIAIGSILAIVGLLLTLASMEIGGEDGVNLKQMVSFAAGFALMGLAVLAFVPALIAVSKFNFGQLMGFVVFVAALIGVFLGASFLTGKVETIAEGMDIMANVLFNIGLAALMSSAGILLIAFGISLMVDAFEKFVALGPAAAEQITSVMEAFGAGLDDVFKGLANGVIEMLKTLIDNRSVIYKYVGIIVGALMTGLTNALPDVLGWVEDVLLKVVNILYTVGPGLVTFVTETVEQLLSAILDTTIRLGPKLNEAVTTLVETALLDILGLIRDVIPELNNTLNMVIVNVTYELLNNINTMTGMIIGALSKLADDLLLGLPIVVVKFTALGVELMVAFMVGLIVGINKSIPLFVENWAKSFVEMVDELCRVIEEQSEPVYEAICKMIVTAIDAVAEWCGRMYYDLNANGPFTGIKKICAYITEGFRRGFESEANKAKLAKTMQNLATFGNGVYCDMQRINSPSKVWEQFGQFQVDGLVGGITSRFGNVKEIGKDLANTMNNSFTSSFGNITETFSNFGSNLLGMLKRSATKAFGGAFEGGFASFGSLNSNDMFDGIMDLNPTITPSLDLSGVKSDAAGLNDLFSGNQVKAISDITDWSKSQTALQDQLKANNALETKNQFNDFMGLMGQYMDIQQYNAEQPTNVNVTLEGDASKMLKILKIEDNKQSKATGLSLYNKGKMSYNNMINLNSRSY